MSDAERPPDWRLDIDPRPCDDCGPRGRQGEPGATGATGDPGTIPAKIRVSFAVLFALMFALAAINLAWSYHLATDQDIDKCSLIEKVVRIRTPEPTAGNPSRLAFAELQAAFRARGDQLGCF